MPLYKNRSINYPIFVMWQGHQRIVIHSFRVGKINDIFLVAVVGKRASAEPGIHVSQQGVGDSLAFGEAGQVADA